MEETQPMTREIAEKLLAPRKFASHAEADEALEQENSPAISSSAPAARSQKNVPRKSPLTSESTRGHPSKLLTLE